MHTMKLLQNLIEKSSPSIHKKRLSCLLDVVGSLLDVSKLWISALGRHIKNNTSEKHNIKKVDTLIGNGRLHQERILFYKMVSQLIIGSKKHPVILVDWSMISPKTSHYFLRASVAMKGRAHTLYEEVHPLNCYANSTIHRTFLNTLKCILPQDCIPIIITDAGFRNPWFRAILDLGWHFIGRLRYQTRIQQVGDSDEWIPVKNFHSQVGNTANYMGKFLVARTKPLEVNMYSVKQKKRYRLKKTKLGQKCQSGHSKKHAKGAQEPWILMTSLPHRHSSAEKVVKLYQQRMQIEESFRDLKNKRDGFRLSESGTSNIKRLENLLLIALLATFVVWLTGIIAIQKQWHYQMQANTVRDRAVLSIFFIGLRVFKKPKQFHLNITELYDAINLLKQLVIHEEII